MKTNILFISAVITFLSFTSCDNAKKSEKENSNDMSTMKDSSMNESSGMKMEDTKDEAPVKVVDLGEVDITVKKELAQSLSAYYEIKNALVIDDSKLAKQKAESFLKVINKVETNKMTEVQKNFYEKEFEKIKNDAEHISETDKVDHQRDHFSTLSTNVYTVVKSFKASEAKVYYDHCPMALNSKGANWISEKEEIKNPYMGSAMPTCGSMKESF